MIKWSTLIFMAVVSTTLIKGVLTLFISYFYFYFLGGSGGPRYLLRKICVITYRKLSRFLKKNETVSHFVLKMKELSVFATI